MGQQQLARPDWEPVTRDEVKLHIGEDGSALDSVIEKVWIPTARRQAEHRTGWTFAKQQIRQTFSGFCDSGMKLRPPLISVDGVEYLDLQGVTQQLQPSEYQVVPTELEGLLLPAIGGGFPRAVNRVGSVRVLTTAGYATRQDVPENAKHWMLMAIATWYQNREGIITGTIVSELPRDYMAALLDEFTLLKV